MIDATSMMANKAEINALLGVEENKAPTTREIEKSMKMRRTTDRGIWYSIINAGISICKLFVTLI